MALVRRFRAFADQRQTVEGCVLTVYATFTWAHALQEIPEAKCWRCKREHRCGDRLVCLAYHSEDVVRPRTIYHYRCIPSAWWAKHAGSLPAWDLPPDGSPAQAGTPSAASPTLSHD